MSKNIDVRKVKYTKSGGLEIKYTDYITKDDVVIPVNHTVDTKKDEPHPDFKIALQAFQPIVKYDEGLKDNAEIEITGVNYFPANEAFILTHVKDIESGRTARNSGRISMNSETFNKLDELQSAWDEMVAETKEYLFNGKRAQLSLAFEGKEEPQEV